MPLQGWWIGLHGGRSSEGGRRPASCGQATRGVGKDRVTSRNPITNASLRV